MTCQGCGRPLPCEFCPTDYHQKPESWQRTALFIIGGIAAVGAAIFLLFLFATWWVSRP